MTPSVDDACVESPISNGEGVSRNSTITHNRQSPRDKAGQLNLNKELITPEKDGNKLPAQAQDECTPVQQTPKTKRTRNSTRLKKVDSPLDIGSKCQMDSEHKVKAFRLVEERENALWSCSF